MSFNQYYQSELSALRLLGRRFSERNPALAPFLGEAGQDPDVERLLEGFAFLTGRLRQKLDDELPELTHSLMHLLWPNYMRPIPAFSILQFDPLKHTGVGVMVAPEYASRKRCGEWRTLSLSDLLRHPHPAVATERIGVLRPRRTGVDEPAPRHECQRQFERM